MNPDSLKVSDYIEVVNDLKEVIDGSDNYSILWMVGGILFALSKPIIKLLKRSFRIQKEIITKEIKDSLNEEQDEFKAIIKEQMQATKDTIEVVKESVQVVKEDGRLRIKQYEGIMGIMGLHVDELGHLKVKVEDHEERITSNEKKIKEIE